MKKGLRLVVLGGPGSGKGTQGQIISSLLGLKHLSTGEYFRDHIQRGTELGILAQSYIGRGMLVPDDVATRLLKDILQSLPADEGFILDGYPARFHRAMIFSNCSATRENRWMPSFILTFPTKKSSVV